MLRCTWALKACLSDAKTITEPQPSLVHAEAAAALKGPAESKRNSGNIVCWLRNNRDHQIVLQDTDPRTKT